MGDDDVAEYALALRELVVNSKPVITSLTMLAGEITGNDPGLTKMVTSLIEKHIRVNRGKVKLTGFYLLDSVCKNVKGHFVQCFGANLVTTFLGAYAAVDDVTRKAMVRLLGTWNNVFPQNTLGAIQRGIAGGGGALPGPPSGVGGFGAGGGGGALPPPPMNAAAQGSLLASMLVGGGDISGLLKSIAFAKAHAHGSALPLTPGVTQQRQTALPPPPAPPPSAPPQTTVAAATPAATQKSHDLPPLGAGFDPTTGEAELRKRREIVIHALYGDKPHQCVTTGARFASRNELDAHLDLTHVRRRAKKSGLHACRSWFVDSSSWIRGAAAEAADNTAAVFFEDGKRVEQARLAAQACSVVVDETQTHCALSGEPFETCWNAEAEEWHYKGAVVLTRGVGAVPKGAYVLFTAVPKGEGDGETETDGLDENEDEENFQPSEMENPSPIKTEPRSPKRKRGSVKTEPGTDEFLVAVKLETEQSGPATRKSARR